MIGRLDGAERLIRLLLDDVSERTMWSREAFLEILAEEEPVLKTAGALIAKLRERAEQLPAMGESPRPGQSAASIVSAATIQARL